MAATGITAAETGMGNRIVDQQQIGMAVARAGAQYHCRVGFRLPLEKLRVFPAEQRAVILLQGRGRVHAPGAGEFVVAQLYLGLVYRAQTLSPEPQTEIRFFVIGGREILVEASKLAELRGAECEKRAGTIVDFASEPEFGRFRVFAAAVTGAGAVAPDDIACFLQFSVEQFDAAAHGAGARVRAQNIDGGAKRAGFDEGVVVEQKQEFAGGEFGALVDGFDETVVFRVADQLDVFQSFEQIAGAVARGVVDDDQLERNIGVLKQCSQAKQTEMSLIVKNEQHRQDRFVRPGKAQFFVARQKLVQVRERPAVNFRLDVLGTAPWFGIAKLRIPMTGF